MATNRSTDMGALVLTQIYLEQSQKTALQKKAKANGTKVAEEVRHAVDAYLAGVSAEELELLDAVTLEAKRHLDAMASELATLPGRHANPQLCTLASWVLGAIPRDRDVDKMLSLPH